jgi:hypothetical protein
MVAGEITHRAKQNAIGAARNSSVVSGSGWP